MTSFELYPLHWDKARWGFCSPSNLSWAGTGAQHCNHHSLHSLEWSSLHVFFSKFPMFSNIQLCRAAYQHKWFSKSNKESENPSENYLHSCKQTTLHSTHLRSGFELFGLFCSAIFGSKPCSACNGAIGQSEAWQNTSPGSGSKTRPPKHTGLVKGQMAKHCGHERFAFWPIARHNS